MAWHQTLAYLEISIGNFPLKCGIDKLTESPNQYELEIHRQSIPFEAESDGEAIQKGMALLGQELRKRIESFEGNPFAVPVGDEEDEENK